MGEPQTVAQVLDGHVTLELESIDRMYLNVYVPKLQHVLGVVGFFKAQRGAKVVSSVLMEPMTTAFVRSIEAFAKQHRVPLQSGLPAGDPPRLGAGPCPNATGGPRLAPCLRRADCRH